MIPALAAEVLLYVLVVATFYAAIKVTLRSAVPPWFLNFKRNVKPRRKPPSWVAVPLLGLALVGLMSFLLKTEAPLVTRPQFEQYLALMLYVTTVASTWDRLTETTGGAWVKVGIATAGAAAFSIVALWNLYPNWLTANLLSVLIAAWYLSFIQALWSFWAVAAVLFVVALGYDVVQTLATSNMVSFAEQAIAISWPGIIRIPLHITSLAAVQGPAIGSGDLLIPGILAVVAGRIAQRTGKPTILWAALGGFAASILLAFVVVTIFNVPQPATIFTVPGVALPVWLVAWRNGVQAELKNRQHPGDGPNPQPPNG